MMVVNNDLRSLLHGDQGTFGHLFPYRDSVPVIGEHILSNMASSSEKVDVQVVKHMLDLRYIGWTVKQILNVDLFPFQIAILQLIWDKPFPMLVACRGGSKCVRGNTLCQTSDGLLQIDEIISPDVAEMQETAVSCSLKGENGYNRPAYGWNNGLSQTKIIKLNSGIEIEATHNHPIRCMDETGHIVWRDADTVRVGDRVPIDRNQYDFGTDTTTSENLGWWLGVMIGDGMFTQRSRLCLAAMDQSIVDQFCRITKEEFNYAPRPIKRSGHYNIYSVEIWDKLNDLYAVGGKDSYTKEVPLLIRKSPRNVVSAFVRGLFDADGCVAADCKTISYSSCSAVLARQVQQILLGFGIVSKLRQRRTCSQNGTQVISYQVTIYGEFNIALYAEHIGFVHKSKQQRLRCRVVKKVNPNDDLIPGAGAIATMVRERFVESTGGPNRKGQGRKNTLVASSYGLSQYGVTYPKLRHFLDSTEHVCGDEDWQHLEQLCDKHYYYDTVVSTEDSECQTFDVHIPDDHSFISNGMISHNSFLLAIYAILRAIFDPGSKIVIVGAGLRQAKLVFGYIESIWNNAPVLRDIVGGGKNAGPRQNVDLCYFRVGDSIVYALPLGDGTKIRGFRANVVIADEFGSIPADVFDVVVRGFAATTKTPVEEAKKAAFDKYLDKLDIPDDIRKQIIRDTHPTRGNQIVHSGTAYYAFNHFAKRYHMWEAIIHGKGDERKIADIFGGDNLVPDNFDYRDYIVIRIPHSHLPDGLLDKKQLAHAKATLPKNIFLMEYGAVFVKDSDGFFSRSLIEGCTVGPNKPIETPDGDVTFTPIMRGYKGRKYVIGIDPAAERDNLTIVVIEVWGNHCRVVYCWAVNKPEFKKRKERGLITDDDYYAYCCCKIRDVVKLFDPIRIEMDSQGGGYAVAEMLRNKKLLNMNDGDFPIYEIIDLKEPKETDGETDGRQILHLVQQSSEFNQQANVCMHKSFETRTMLFPAFDSVKILASLQAEKAEGIVFDTFEDNVYNLEELKNEICTIQMSETATGREKFDTPQVVQPGAVEGRQRKGRLRKDRYTSLLLAHKFIYDTSITIDNSIDYENVPGNFQKSGKIDKDAPLYRGPGVGRMRNAEHSRHGGQVGAVKNGKRL